MISNSEYDAREFFTDKKLPDPSYYHIEAPKDSPSMHSFFSDFILPAAKEYKNDEAIHRRRFADRISNLNQRGYFTQRRSIYVNGKLIDVLIVGKEGRLKQGRWILNSLPNMDFLENAITDDTHLNRMRALRANAVFFNYPGVGCSQGEPNQSDMIASYRAVLKMLETNLDAKKILMWGTSIGGGVQGAALENYEFKDGVVYLSIQDQTFSALDQVTDDLIEEASSSGKVHPIWDSLIPNAFSRWVSNRIKNSGWSLETLSSAIQLERLGIRQIVLQNTREPMPHIGSSDDIVGDGIISARRSLAGNLLNIKFMVENEVDGWTTKRFLGVTSEHTTGYTHKEEKMIIRAIQEELKLSVPYGLPSDFAISGTASSSSSSS